MDFCNKLQALRKQANLTQDELAVRIGVSRQAISKWESGNAYPDLKNIQILCSFFSVSPDMLLYPKEETQSTVTEYYHFDEETLGSNIKRIRTARGITQETFAEQMKVSRQSVSKWENGSVIPKTEILISMLDVLQTDLSELLPPVIEAPLQESNPKSEEVGDASESTEQSEVPTEEAPVASPSKKKKKKKKLWLLFLLLPVFALILTACIIGAILFKPFLESDPLQDSFEEIFFDPQIPFSVIDRMSREGVEITLGTGSNAIVLTLQINDESIAIKGFEPDKAKIFLLPRKNVEQSLEESVFHPNSNTQLSLSTEEYDQLLSLLKGLEGDEKDAATDYAELIRTVEAILLEWERLAPPEESFSLVEDRLALKKTVSYTIDKQKMLLMLDALSAEVKENKELNGMYGLAEELKELDPERSTSLDALIAELKDELEKNVQSVDIVFSFTVQEGKIEGASYSCVIKATDGTVESTSLDLKCVYGSKHGLVITYESSGETDGIFLSTVSKYTYSKEVLEDRVQLALTVENSDELGSEGGSETYKSKESYTLDYNKSTHEYTARYIAPELATNMKAVGTWEFNADTGKLAFSLKLLQADEETLIETDALALLVRALGDVPFPEGKSLLSLSVKEMRTLYIYFPAKKLDVLLAEITGEPLELDYSRDGLILPDGVEEVALLYQQKLLEYHEAKGDREEELDKRAVYIYNERYGLYVILRYGAYHTMHTQYAYKLDEDILEFYRRAEIVDGKLEIHDDVQT